MVCRCMRVLIGWVGLEMDLGVYVDFGSNHCDIRGGGNIHRRAFCEVGLLVPSPHVSLVLVSRFLIICYYLFY